MGDALTANGHVAAGLLAASVANFLLIVSSLL